MMDRRSIFRLAVPAFKLLLFLGIVADAPAQVHIEPVSTERLKGLSLEELMNIEVVSPSRREEPLSQTAAAIHVITGEDIRRAGAMTLPDALRLAPGVQVAQVDAHTWAVSARGFNDVFANKLLVLQDGRTLYTPLFSGVFWDVQDVLLEDLDRIEVIRGPGAALWGANAVNGVVNIITKKSKDTQGWLATAGAGTEERGFGAVRYGGKVNEALHYRVFGKYFARDDSAFPDGADAYDRWDIGRGGFRVDWDPNEQNVLLVEGHAYAGTLQQIYANVFTPTNIIASKDDNRVRGQFLLGRWTHLYSELSDVRLQVYYDRSERDTLIFEEDRDTFDADFQHRFALTERQHVIWGAGFRTSWDNLATNASIGFTPTERELDLYSAFVQDEIALAHDRLRLTLGSKFEHNEFTGFEIQPNARLLWTPATHLTFWASVARAVRTPSRAEDDIRLQQLVSPLLPAVTLEGNNDFNSEKLTAYEVGHRWQPHARLSLDVAAFYNDYNDLRTVEPVPGNLLLFRPQNRMEGETYGVEFAPSVQVAEWWRLHAAYSYLQIQLHPQSDSLDPNAEAEEGRSPHHQLVLRSMMNLPGRVQLDGALRYVDALPSLGIDSYTVVDLRLGWRPTAKLEFSVVGRNLLDSRHPEFAPSFIRTPVTEVEHSLYAKITWEY